MSIGQPMDSYLAFIFQERAPTWVRTPTRLMVSIGLFYLKLLKTLALSPLLRIKFYISNLTVIFDRVQQDDPKAAEELIPLVYRELRQIAAQKMAAELPGQTLQPTALVHEAWLRLGADVQPAWQNRAHFFSAAAEAMRRILVDSARRKRTAKHGGHLERVELDSIELSLPMANEEVLALDEALIRLAAVDTRAVEVVKLCFFLGLTRPQAAEQMDVSVSTVERLWSFARAWLFREIKKPLLTED